MWYLCVNTPRAQFVVALVSREQTQHPTDSKKHWPLFFLPSRVLLADDFSSASPVCFFFLFNFLCFDTLLLFFDFEGGVR